MLFSVKAIFKRVGGGEEGIKQNKMKRWKLLACLTCPLGAVKTQWLCLTHLSPDRHSKWPPLFTRNQGFPATIPSPT